MNITVFLGAPGSGKGTQAKQLSENFGFVHFSTGDMLRTSIKEMKPVGLKAKSFMDQGNLVPDGVMIELIEEALDPLSDNADVLLDGFPRTVPQAEALDSKIKTTVAKAINFNIPDSILITRLTGRRICPNCGESFHLVFIPPLKLNTCNRCSSTLIQRTDDSEAVVLRRLEVFKSQNQGLLDYFGNRKNIITIEADRAVACVQKELLSILKH